ncbi:ATP-dependent RNA helicase DEAH13-like [Herrania umbratica]|uniref:RNA helicase n=1 Tax=Herrania umbratica TaxID=108875 RepID=A0A6J1A2F5_9ROSI|nr:ATP-dependent RNA helicase DEAH13-like [Herrania umbratica]
MESSGLPVELMTGQDSWSLEGSDSNALILPTKRSKKRKENNLELEKAKEKQNPKLSKSQIRKLKMLEEEKEKAFWLSKSIEALEKYKILEDAYSLLWSSKTIGLVCIIESLPTLNQNMFSKAGLELPYVDKSSKGRDSNNLSSSSEPEPELEEIDSRKDISKYHIGQPLIIEIEVARNALGPLASSQEPVFGKDLGPSCSSVDTVPIKEVPLKDNSTPSEEDIKNCIPKLSADDRRESNMSKGPLSASTVVHVLRPDEVENKRKDLPIVMMEQEIMEAINENFIICGETGCGKTTQVPQFLYESGFGSSQSTFRSGIIGVTQPHHVAVLATAMRVTFELGLHLGKEVGFQVRHDKKIGDRMIFY